MKTSVPSSTLISRTSLLAVAVPALVLAFVCVTADHLHAQSYSTLHHFAGKSDGDQPWAPVIVDSEGNLYGTTRYGGDHNCDPQGCGIVFKVDPAGNETVLHAFTGGSDGASPDAGVVRDDAGNLYGAAAFGGTAEMGTVFKLDTTGKLTVLHAFSGRDGNVPLGTLVRDSAGNLYGTTLGGGILSCLAERYKPPGCGVVFKLDKTGKETVLHRFNGHDGAYPYAGLVRDLQGNLYGTTEGTVFKVDSRGKFTVVYRFNGVNDGSWPYASLIVDAEGNLYGTTVGGGAYGVGTVFKIDRDGNETILHNFNLADGASPHGSLIQDAGGNLYGTTLQGGDLACKKGGGWGCGTVFKHDANGVETILHKFHNSPGGFPTAGVVMDTSGTLYGTTTG